MTNNVRSTMSIEIELVTLATILRVQFFEFPKVQCTLFSFGFPTCVPTKKLRRTVSNYVDSFIILKYIQMQRTSHNGRQQRTIYSPSDSGGEVYCIVQYAGPCTISTPFPSLGIARPRMNFRIKMPSQHQVDCKANGFQKKAIQMKKKGIRELNTWCSHRREYELVNPHHAQECPWYMLGRSGRSAYLSVVGYQKAINRRRI